MSQLPTNTNYPTLQQHLDNVNQLTTIPQLSLAMVQHTATINTLADEIQNISQGGTVNSPQITNYIQERLAQVEVLRQVMLRIITKVNLIASANELMAEGPPPGILTRDARSNKTDKPNGPKPDQNF